jgi:hypothetical protein
MNIKGAVGLANIWSVVGQTRHVEEVGMLFPMFPNRKAPFTSLKNNSHQNK